HLLQQQVLYAISTDVEGLRSSLRGLLSALVENKDRALSWLGEDQLQLTLREEFGGGPIALYDFELPVTIEPENIRREAFDENQERELLLALLKAEEGTLKDILERLYAHLRTQ